MPQNVNYYSRNFSDIRTDLINYARQYYPDIFNDFNDASVGMMLLELNAAVGDMLSFNTDRMFQETQIDYAQERKSLLSIARTFGLKVPGNRPSVTICDFSVILPVLGNTFDLSYAPIIRSGAQVTGGGKVFETSDDIDFSSPFASGGIPNRIIIPNFDSNGNIINYTLTKREMVINGFTKIFKRVIGISDVQPFLSVILPDNNVLSVTSVITLDGTNFTTDPTLDQFLDMDNQWFELDSLAESTVFIEDTTAASDNAGIKVGKYINVDMKFIREYTDLGFTKMTFGGGSQDVSSLSSFGANPTLVNQIGNFINNLSLGITLSPNTTLFVMYRVGGGGDTNIGQGVLTSTGIINMVVNGNNQATNNTVVSSLTVNNPFPALGGRDIPSIEEIRNLVKYNFAAQNRAVTIKDYVSRISLMPGDYGVPFRTGVYEEQNKIKIYILGLDQNGNLSNNSTNTLKSNIAAYLSNYKMINDYIEVGNGRIINLSFQIDLYIDKNYPQTQIISTVINDVISYMNVNNFNMGDNIYLGDLFKEINNVSGVLNVIDLRVYNMVGGNYSLNEISQPYLDATTREIDTNISDYTLFGDPISLFEIKFGATDVTVRVKN